MTALSAGAGLALGRCDLKLAGPGVTLGRCDRRDLAISWGRCGSGRSSLLQLEWVVHSEQRRAQGRQFSLGVGEPCLQMLMTLPPEEDIRALHSVTQMGVAVKAVGHSRPCNGYNIATGKGRNGIKMGMP